MITKVEIENFQSHEKSVIEFHEGVNVITGSSDSGKSAVIRAIKWLLRNRPLGTAYRSDFSKEPTRVTVDFNGKNRWISRVRGESVNYYLVPGDVKLEALRAEIPGDVGSIAKIHDCSLQGQHDGYFLLQSTAGEVARELNDIVGLDVIDAVFKNIASLIRKCKSDKEVQQEIITECEEELKNYEGLDEKDKKLATLEKLLTKRKEDREERRAILSIQKRISEIDDSVKDYTEWLEIESEMVKLSKVLNEWYREEQLKDRIEDLLFELKEVEKQAAEYDDFITTESKAKELDDIVSELRKEERRSKSLSVLLEEAERLDGEISDSDFEVGALVEERTILLSGADVCPFCYQTMDEETIKRIEEYNG